MRNRFFGLGCAALLIAVSAPSSFAQEGRGKAAPLKRTLPIDKPYNPHDLAGIWTRSNTQLGWGGGSTCPDCGDRGFGADVPAFTPAGQKAFDANKPSYGRTLGTPDAAAHPEEHIGRRRAVSPANGTD